MHGVGPDAPVAADGSQALSPYRFDLVDPEALAAVAGVLARGAAKYGEDNWRRMYVREHLNHLITHVYAYLAGDASDDHLTNAACRAIFALATHLRPELSEAARKACPRG